MDLNAFDFEHPWYSVSIYTTLYFIYAMIAFTRTVNEYKPLLVLCILRIKSMLHLSIYMFPCKNSFIFTGGT